MERADSWAIVGLVLAVLVIAGLLHLVCLLDQLYEWRRRARLDRDARIAAELRAESLFAGLSGAAIPGKGLDAPSEASARGSGHSGDGVKP